MEPYENVLIVGEMESERLSGLTAQLLRIGKELSHALKRELHLLVLSGKSEQVDKEGFCYGADRVYAASHQLLENYTTDAYLQAMEQVVTALKPSIILFGHSDRGSDLAPRLAFRLRTGATLDCMELRIDGESGLLEQIKPVFGGKAYCHYTCVGGSPQIASVRDGVFDPADYVLRPMGEVTQLSLFIDPSKIRTRVIGTRQDDDLSLAQKLGAASIVVSGGRGLKNQDGVGILKETAHLLDGAVSGSRPAIDYGWLPGSLQVGLTGKKIKPQLYIAVGISGALQHMAGCLKSKVIVAINSDESAPIFRFSHYGVVDDYKQVLKGFNEEVRLAREHEGE
jgi:electron transfer flavoprotein alpha subunit